eukprot:scaffold19114_cov118-Isochrysis_galbana.AAC.6
MLRASGDSAGHPVPEDPTAYYCSHSPPPLSPHPFSLFGPLFVGGGMVKGGGEREATLVCRGIVECPVAFARQRF